MKKKTTTAAKTKSAWALDHEAKQKDKNLDQLRANRDLSLISLRPDPKVTEKEKLEWSGDFDITPVLQSNFTHIHAVPPVSYGVDVRTNEKFEGEEWKLRLTAEQVARSRYYRKSGKKWESCDGLREITVTVRPDQLWTLKLISPPAETEKLFRGYPKLLAKKVEQLTTDRLHRDIHLQVPLVSAHFERSIAHWHLRVATVDKGVLLWPRDETGAVPPGQKGLNLLGPCNLAAMRCVKAGLYSGDTYANSAFARRCNEVAEKYQNGLPLDYSCAIYVDELTDTYIASLGPKANEVYRNVQHCYRKHLETKFAASPYNLKGRIKDLTADNDGLRKELSELTSRIVGIESQFKGPPAAQVARVTNRPIGSNSETDNSTSAATHQSKPQNVPKREKLPGQRHEFQAEIPNPWPELKYKARAAVYWTNGMRWGMTDRAELIFGNENLLKLLEMRKKLGPVDGSIAFFTDRKMSMNEVEAEMRDLVDGRRQPRHIWTEAVEVNRPMPQKAIVSVPAEAKKQATKVQTEEIDTFTAAIASFESEVARKRRPVEIEM